jgi:HEAT repeat protein
MGFDAENFGLGLLAGWVSAYGIYRARHRIAAVVRSGQSGAESARTFATRSADSRYVKALIDLCEHAHLAGEFARLSDILIEPRFLPALPLLPLDDEDEVARDVFELVPRVHDHPYLHAPYNLDTLAIDELARGDRALALLGMPGSGRSTALMAIALHSIGHVKFKPPVDRVQQKLDAEEARLSEKERATRIKDRIMIQERAKERLADERGVTFDTDDSVLDQIPPFQRMMPVYVHLADVRISADEFGAEIDPAEPLVRAVQYRLGGIAARTAPRNIYKRLAKGQVLLLVDGYDDLPEAEQRKMGSWLRALIAQYRDNFFIVAGPATGYGKLTSVGLTPVFLRPWSDLDTDRAAEYWANIWARLGGKKRRRDAKRPSQESLDRAKINNRALSPLEVSLKIWANYAEDTDRTGIEGWLRAFLMRHLPDELESLLPYMAQMAVIQVEDGFITSEKLQTLSIGSDVVAGADEPDDSDASKKGKKKEADSETASSQGKLLGKLRNSGLLVRYRGDRYQFRHPLIAAYLASLTLRTAATTELITRAMQPNWTAVIGCAALHTDISAAVKARLDAPTDILHNLEFEAARWLAYAGADASWRGSVLRLLGNLMTAPSQYPYVRERAAAALIGTRDRTTAAIFRRALRMDNPLIRQLSCLSIGAIGDEDGVNDLAALLQDRDESVQLAAAMSLSAIRSDKALETMVIEFTRGAERMRQALAIAFASLPDEGYPILFDAMEEPDMLMRRAAVFGLRRLRTTWALIAIYRAFLEDEQWYVRSAAQIAFQEMQYGRERSATTGFPPPESLAWLAQWAAKRGENLPSGEAAKQMLLRALQEGDPETRVLAASAMGQLGMADTAKALYSALGDKQETVRIAAQRSLAELQAQVGAALPAPA